MDNPDITMEEYVRYETEKALINGQMYNWETAKMSIRCIQPHGYDVLNNLIQYSLSNTMDTAYQLLSSSLRHGSFGTIPIGTVHGGSFDMVLLVLLERISKKRTKNEAKTTKPDTEWKSVAPPVVEQFNLEEPIVNPDPLAPMDDNRTMAQLLEAPTAGYEDAIVVPKITADNFELKHGLLNLVQNKQFVGHAKERSHAHTDIST
ncbi:hypothetical protein Tco_1509156 [Tanacetum coccineum]